MSTIRNAFAAIALGFVLLPSCVSAAQNYQMLEPIPFVKGTDEGGRVSFTDLLSGFFELSLVLGAALTAVMLTIGGVQYMTSDAIGGKQAGKERIRNSLTGFLLLLGIYVILKTINPALLNFDLRQIVDAGCKQTDSQGKNVCTERNTPNDRIVDSTNPLTNNQRSQLAPGDGAYIQYREANGRWTNAVFKNLELCKARIAELEKNSPAIAERVKSSGGCQSYSTTTF